MRFSSRSRMSIILSLVALASMIIGLVATGVLPGPAAQASTTHFHIDCASAEFAPSCAEVLDSEQVFGKGVYVGHDEPSTLFYSNHPGAGNRMQWQLILPKDPPPTPLSPTSSFNFQLHPAFWFGMAMCDTQSFPEQVSTCTPDSDSNIVDPAVSANHPGVAFTEMQFYPPGWAKKPFGPSCDATKWCAAFNIDSLSQNAVTGQSNNAACLNVAGVEPVNFAFITKNGVPQAPVNPVESTLATFTPDPAKDLFMNSGDRIIVTMHDTAHGLRIDLNDVNTHEHGFMVASAANSFGQVKFDPNGTTCQNIPYDFHPMYSTSSEQTRVTWAAHSYNIAFSDEIGHFDFCDNVDPNSGTCIGNEGSPGDQEPADGDDFGCFPASDSLLVQVSGCIGTNSGFDGVSYQQNAWPDGKNGLHPTPIQFTSPTTGPGNLFNYSRVAFETDLPRIELNTCNRSTGSGCTLIPTTDDNTPAAFYPFYSITFSQGDCRWEEGANLPHSFNFGGNAEYGKLLTLTYTGTGGTPITRINDFRNVIPFNPCPDFDF